MIELSEHDGRPDHRTTTEPTGGRSFRRTIATRDFRLLLGGTTTSLLGDQFALIAIPWLTLTLTGDPLALGIVLALEGIPRAIFMLLGGAITDRVPPRRIMLLADLGRGLLVAAVAIAVATGTVGMWTLYGFALVFGLVSGVAVPAQNSIVPRLLPHDDLETGNAVMMGAGQVIGFVGPTLAGATIALATSATTGIAIALAIDAATFAVSATLFARMRPTPIAPGAAADSLMASIGDGVRSVRDDRAMRFVFRVLAAVNFGVVGPLMVGIPMIAHERLGASAAAFGVLMGAFAAGNLAGLVVAGAGHRPSPRAMRWLVLGNLTGYGIVLIVLSASAHVWSIALMLAALGAGNGFLAVVLFSWVQGRTPPERLGRTISLVTFASFGLVSVSQALAGVTARWNLSALFVVAGGLVLSTTVWAATRPGLSAFVDSLTAPAIDLTVTPEEEPAT